MSIEDRVCLAYKNQSSGSAYVKVVLEYSKRTDFMFCKVYGFMLGKSISEYRSKKEMNALYLLLSSRFQYCGEMVSSL